MSSEVLVVFADFVAFAAIDATPFCIVGFPDLAVERLCVFEAVFESLVLASALEECEVVLVDGILFDNFES